MEWKCSYSRLGQQLPTKSHSAINDVSADSEGSESTKRGYCRSRVDSQPEEMGSTIGATSLFMVAIPLGFRASAETMSHGSGVALNTAKPAKKGT